MLLSLIRGLLGGQIDHPVAAVSQQVADPPRRPSHRRRRPLQTLRAAGIGTVTQRRALRAADVRTTEDLLRADPGELVQQLQWPHVAQRRVRRWQAAIRMARAIATMTPRDALMLQAIHRRTLQAIASEAAPRLHGDLQRYALSSRGAKHLGDRDIPTIDDVRRWIERAKKRVQ